jgi:adenylate kinase
VPKPQRLVVLFGGPGSGKGVQATLLSDALGLPHVASGDLLRDSQARQTPLGHAAREFMARGDLLPDELVSDIVFARVAEPDAARGAILDGFPRTLSQAELLDRWVAEHHWQLRDVIYLDVPPAILLQRLTERHRADDKPAVALHRIEESMAELPALLEKYQARRIDGTGSIEQIHERIMSLVAQEP